MRMTAIKTTLAAATLAVTGLGVAAPAGAQGDKTAEDWIQARQDNLASAAAATKSVACSLKGEGCPRAFDYLTLQARAIAHAASMAPQHFRKGPFPDAQVETAALPKIWDEYDQFTQGFETMEKHARDMVEAARNEDLQAYAAAFKKTTDACSECHDTYRED
ncbi:c-type cytochrome [Rhodovibrio sodomensis]|nr:cytochrome c [Rhodovibrio sodomensis]